MLLKYADGVLQDVLLNKDVSINDDGEHASSSVMHQQEEMEDVDEEQVIGSTCTRYSILIE